MAEMEAPVAMDVDKSVTKKGKNDEKTEDEKKEEVEQLVLGDISQNVALIKKHLLSREARFMVRVLRSMTSLRKKLTQDILKKTISTHFPSSDCKEFLLGIFNETAPMATSEEEEEESPASQEPEVEAYFFLLSIVFFLDSNQLPQAVETADKLIERVKENRRRTADMIASKAYFYYSLCHEKKGDSKQIRGELHAALRTATLRTDEHGQVVLINCLLRNLLNENLIEQAKLLVLKTVFPENSPTNETARYMYYRGRIHAIELDYSEAHGYLEEALRKAPICAKGFMQTVQKLEIVVRMLLGEIPERELFRQPLYRKPLQPYFQITQAVRTGDLAQFEKVVEENSEVFRKDKTFTLILRLRHNVIKTAIRMINLSYSRISLSDIASKLGLDSAEEAEFIVAKSIRDGVVDATIDHSGGFVRTKELTDVYSTDEPHYVFDQRINFCLKLHGESIKAMRYPPNAYRKYLETPEQRREREAQEAELAKEIEKEEKDES